MGALMRPCRYPRTDERACGDCCRCNGRFDHKYDIHELLGIEYNMLTPQQYQRQQELRDDITEKFRLQHQQQQQQQQQQQLQVQQQQSEPRYTEEELEAMLE